MAVKKMISESYSITQTPIQYAAITAYRDFFTADLQSYIGAQRKILKFCAKFTADSLRGAGAQLH